MYLTLVPEHKVLPGKASHTHLALEGLLLCVRTFVTLQMFQPCERTNAGFADVRTRLAWLEGLGSKTTDPKFLSVVIGGSACNEYQKRNGNGNSARRRRVIYHYSATALCCRGGCDQGHRVLVFRIRRCHGPYFVCLSKLGGVDWRSFNLDGASRSYRWRL
jgi:hypothetical protein